VSSHIIVAARRGVRRVCAHALPFVVLSLLLHCVAAAAQPVELPPVNVVTTIKRIPPLAPSSAPGDESGNVVTAPTTVPTPVTDVANSITVITAADIAQKQRRTLPDALADVPGLNIVQGGGPGGQTSVFMRGTNSNHVKVLIDGIDVTDPSSPTQIFDFGQMLTADIARIEVLRGPQSGLYGADAIGGVISITTKKGEGPPKAYVSVEGGSFGTFNQSTGVSGSQGRFNYMFNVQHWHAASTPVTPLDLLQPGQTRNNDYYDNNTYSTRLGYDFNDQFSVNVVSRYVDSTLDFTGDFDDNVTGPDFARSTQRDHQSYTRGEAVWSLFDGRFKNYFGAAYSDVHSTTTFPQSPAGNGLAPGSGPEWNDGTRIKVDWRGVAVLTPNHTLVMGLESELFGFNQFSPFGGIPSASNTNKAGYIELQSQYWDRLFLVENIRYDVNGTFGGYKTYRLAPAYIVPWTETKLKASYGTGFKAPTLQQFFSSFPNEGFFANANLLPEESKGYDIGFEQPLWHDRVRFGATYFHNNIRNLIEAVGTGQFLFGGLLEVEMNENIGHATTEGAETFATFAVTPKLNLRADYTYTIARDDTTNEELLRRPKNKASLAADWKATDKLSLTGTVLYVGSWMDFPRDGLTSNVAPPYHVINVAANYAWTEHVTWFGRIDNLTNEHYEVPIGFLRPGFGIFGGVRLTN
jgi:vitamin B12 transporter